MLMASEIPPLPEGIPLLLCVPSLRCSPHELEGAPPSVCARRLRPGVSAGEASRQDNFRHELSPLADGSTSATDFRRATRALARALAQRRISPEKAAVLVQISNLVRQSGRYAQEEAFHSARGHAWDTIRKLLDGPAPNS